MAKKTHGPGIDDPLIVRKSGNDYFYYKNHQGSVTELRDSNGAGYKTYVYDAFGSMEETGPTFNRGFTYTGRELHNRSGLYYYRARFYNPKLGRFISQDPIGYLGGANLYAYVGNAPAKFRDPLGLCKDEYPVYTYWIPGEDPFDIIVMSAFERAGSEIIEVTAFAYYGWQTTVFARSYVFGLGMDNLSFGLSTYTPDVPIGLPAQGIAATAGHWEDATDIMGERFEEALKNLQEVSTHEKTFSSH